jgi:hypothetical protein
MMFIKYGTTDHSYILPDLPFYTGFENGYRDFPLVFACFCNDLQHPSEADIVLETRAYQLETLVF